MKRTVTLLATTLLVLVTTGAALAERGPIYLRAHLGVALTDDLTLEATPNDVDVAFDPGMATAIAAGYDLGKGRIEVEVARQSNEIDGIGFNGGVYNPGGNITTYSAMLNSYADYPTGTVFTPYFSAGVGMARVRINQDLGLGISFNETEDDVFAWQVGVGTAVRIATHLDLEVGYRYFSTGDPSFEAADGSTVDTEYSSHQINIGARVTF